ncbi:MAG TPA: NAD(P)-dependent oxidoreductase [Burkholderiales bacterium]|nr:NAD(P)-dependent oxidoreductase [Burkholderiales bacterium]
MLEHLEREPRNPSRVAVLGAGGFIAGAVVSALQHEGIAVVKLGRPALDLLQPGARDVLLEKLKADDVLVFASARAPCKDVAMLRENLLMAQAVCAALATRPVAHVVYISSDAVYKDSSSALTEASCAEPGSLHGVMHLARELALKSAFGGPLALVRPTLVYGLDDPHNGYGPNRFRRLASAGKDIVLFGEGEERRDHVDVADVALLVLKIIQQRSRGIANAVSGEVVSFRQLAEFAASEFAPRVAVKASPRSGPMPHNGYRPFDNRAVLAAFPGFRFKGWREGLSAVHARQKRSAAA